MPTVNIHAAKTHLSRLVEKAAAGEEVIIAKAGVPVARLVPMDSRANKKRIAGLLKVKIPPEFYEPLPDDIIDMMINGPIFPDEKS